MSSKKLYCNVLLLCIVIMMFVGCDWNIKKPEPDAEIVSSVTSDIGILMTNTAGLLENNPQDITFTLKLDETLTKFPVTLYLNDEVLAEMKDDGEGRDIEAGDGLYTYCDKERYTVKEKTLNYKVECNGTYSNVVSIHAFDIPDESAFDEFNTLVEEIQQIDEFFYKGDNVKSEYKYSAINAVYSNAEKLKDSGKIIQLEKNSSSVTAQFDSGLWYAYTPKIAGEEGGGTNSNLFVLTYQPYMSGEDNLNCEQFDNAAVTLREAFEKVVFLHELDDKEVDLESLKLMGSSQIIIWNGHGAHSDTLGYIAGIGEYYSEETIGPNLSWAEFFGGAVVRLKSGRLGITSNYVKSHFHNMTNSMLYMGTCHSYENTFITECMNKGLQAYVGFDDSVYASYDRAMIENISKTLCEINVNTEDYYTLSEAIDIAKEKLGDDDGHGTHIQFLGEYQIDTLKKKEYELTDGRYVSVYYKNETPENGIVHIEGEGFEPYDCPAFKSAKIEDNTLVIEGGLKKSYGDLYEYSIYEIPLAEDFQLGFENDGIIIPSSHSKEENIKGFNAGWYKGGYDWNIGSGGFHFEVQNGQVILISEFGS